MQKQQMTSQLLPILQNRGIELTKKTATEFCSPCPKCGGNDRFQVWPGTNKFWCRQCEWKGDDIQLLRDLDGLSFEEAKKAVGKGNGSGGKQHIGSAAKGGEKISYPYYDESGQVLSRVCRTGQDDNKKFWIQKPNGAGGWKNGGKDVKKVLYNLPDLSRVETVFLVEGEKDAKNLKELGFVATTSPHGSGAWARLVKSFQIDKPLHGKTVYIIPDNDPEGEKYVQAVAATLNGKAKEIKILRLPDLPLKGDITDFLTIHGEAETVKTLTRLIAETPTWIPPAKKGENKGETGESEHNAGLILAYLETIEEGTVFRTQDLYNHLCLATESKKSQARNILAREKKAGRLEVYNNQSGTYRKVRTEVPRMDLSLKTVKPLGFLLPLGLSDLVKIYPGNIITVAGDSNSGKTAMVLTIANDNVEHFKVRFFSSEMDEEEMVMRLEPFGDYLRTHPNFEAIKLSSDYHDLILTGKGNLNIIDYLEVTEEHWKVATYLKQIHDKLNGALCVAAIQKRDRESDNALGGYRALEKPRLALSMSADRIKILKGKNPKNPKIIPDGMCINFRLEEGCRFIKLGNWTK